MTAVYFKQIGSTLGLFITVCWLYLATTLSDALEGQHVCVLSSNVSFHSVQAQEDPVLLCTWNLWSLLESLSLVCELIFLELRVRFELNKDLNVHSSSTSLFIPCLHCHASLKLVCVWLCTHIPHSLTNSKPGYTLGLKPHPSEWVSVCGSVFVCERCELGQVYWSHLFAVEV